MAQLALHKSLRPRIQNRSKRRMRFFMEKITCPASTSPSNRRASPSSVFEKRKKDAKRDTWSLFREKQEAGYAAMREKLQVLDSYDSCSSQVSRTVQAWWIPRPAIWHISGWADHRRISTLTVGGVCVRTWFTMTRMRCPASSNHMMRVQSWQWDPSGRRNMPPSTQGDGNASTPPSSSSWRKWIDSNRHRNLLRG